MQRARRMGWWLAVPVGVALGLALAVGLDRAATPAEAQGGGSEFELSVEQMRINQRIGQQGVKRANRANSRLDQLTSGARGPAGPVGPAGPAGPGATRIAYSAAAGAPARPLFQLAGVTWSASCAVGGPAGATLSTEATVAQATTFVMTSAFDSGTDPNAPPDPLLDDALVLNFQVPLTPGPATAIGAPLGAVLPGADTFGRLIIEGLFITPTQTLSVNVAALVNGGRCSVDGVAMPS